MLQSISLLARIRGRALTGKGHKGLSHMPKSYISQILRTEACPPHFWDIEPACGPVSRGVCRYCHEQRDFRNYVPEYESVQVGGRGRGSLTRLRGAPERAEEWVEEFVR